MVRDCVKKIIEDMDLMTPWQTFGCILVDELGMPEDKFPFYDSGKRNKVSKVMARVLEEGNFGKEREMYKDRCKEGYFQGKVKSLYLHSNRAIQLFCIFPSHTLRQFWYTFRNGIRAVWIDKVN